MLPLAGLASRATQGLVLRRAPRLVKRSAVWKVLIISSLNACSVREVQRTMSRDGNGGETQNTCVPVPRVMFACSAGDAQGTEFQRTPDEQQFSEIKRVQGKEVIPRTPREPGEAPLSVQTRPSPHAEKQRLSRKHEGLRTPPCPYLLLLQISQKDHREGKGKMGQLTVPFSFQSVHIIRQR